MPDSHDKGNHFFRMNYFFVKLFIAVSIGLSRIISDMAVARDRNKTA